MKLAASVLIFLALNAYADGGSSSGTRGGGDSVANGSGRKLLDLAEGGNSSYFDFQMSDYNPTFAKNMSWLFVEDVIPNQIFSDVLELCLNENSWEFVPTMEADFRMKPLRWRFSEVPLEKIHDEGTIGLSDPSTERQLAIQQDGIVTVYHPDFLALDADSKVAFKLHEGILCAVIRTAPEVLAKNGTEPIRKLVKAFSADVLPTGTDSLTTLDAAVTDAYNRLGIPSADVLAKKLGVSPDYYPHIGY